MDEYRHEYNFVIRNEYYEQEKDLIYGMFRRGIDEITYIDYPRDMYDLLVNAGIFTSRSKARSQWDGDKDIPKGYSEFKKLGKYKKGIFIFNPIDTK